MTNVEKIEFLYSKFVSVNTSQASTFNSQIWRQGDQIPSVAPTFDVNGEYKGPSGDVILQKVEHVKMTQVSGFPNAFSSSEVYDIVSYQNGFDDSYSYNFYTKSSNGNYVEIPFQKDGYFFDHDTGILFFPEGRTILYNPASLYVTFVKYVGLKGIDVTSQFSGFPQSGSVGPTGPTGPVGETGPADEFSIRYKGTWSSSLTYSKWDLVKYGGKFFLSTSNTNINTPDNGQFWQAFGIPQLSSSFNYPDYTYWVSPSFSTGAGRFNSIEDVIADINSESFQNTTVVVYPGDYVIYNNLSVRSGVNINFVFYGNVNVSFNDELNYILFNMGSKIEFRGNDFNFVNGELRLLDCNLSVVGGKLNSVTALTTNMADTSRLMMVDSDASYLYIYGSFLSLRSSNIVNKLTMDEVAVVHIEDCMIQARPEDDSTQEKIEIISAVVSGTPPGFGYEFPALLIKNSRILSNGPVLYSTIDPLYGLKLGLISSALYVKDSSVDFLDFSDAMDAIVFDTVINTPYDDTKLVILNFDGQFQTVNANFED